MAVANKWLNEAAEVVKNTETHLLTSPSLQADFSFKLFQL